MNGSNQQGALHVKLLVGLGNPGREYSNTRHNAGFWCVQRLAKENSITLSQRRRDAVIGEGVIAGTPVVLAKPRTFVNDSGRAVRFLLARYRATPQDLLVIYDDMNLPLGKLRLRTEGSDGGHRGIRSVIGAIGTQEFARLRIGIGRPESNTGDVDYVLGAMPPGDRRVAEEAVERAARAVAVMLAEGLDEAMNRFN